MTTPNIYGLPELFTPLAPQNAQGAFPAGVYNNGHAYFYGILGAGTAPTPAAGAGAGSGASVGSLKGFDIGGSFAVTTAGTPAAGVLATVTFGTALSAAPASVIVTCFDQTGNSVVPVGPTSITATGFSVYAPSAPTTAHSLLVSYQVLLQQP